MRMFLVTAMAAAAVAALSPYPLAAQTPATAPAVTPPPPMVKPGELRKLRAPKRTSCQMLIDCLLEAYYAPAAPGVSFK